jgi:signal transduction histidine kinase
MQRVWQVFSPDESQARRLLWLSAGLVALPLALFSWWLYIQAPSRLAQLTPVTGVQVWHEDVGNTPFNQASLRALVRTPPDWAQMQWVPTALPSTQPLGTAIDLPPDAPKRRAWFRIPIPQSGADAIGRQGLLGLRVQGGPWALWVDGQLVQANLSDWRIQWNVPLRVALPLNAREALLAVPYAAPQGYAVGTLLVGPMDVVDTAWQERNLLHTDMARFMAGIALLLMLISAQLAIARPQEHIFKMLALNGGIWSVSSIQYAFDVTGQDHLTVWLGSAVDSAITWTVVFGVIFAMDYMRMRMPRLKAGLVVYAAVSTLLTLPVWDWQKNALIAQQYFNVGAFVVGLVVLGWRLKNAPSREGGAMLGALALQLVLGVHTLENLTNQTNPDSFYSFPLGTLALYMVFTYAMTRRSVVAIEVAEQHEAELRHRLDEQERHLAEQHALLQQLEVGRHLFTQRAAFMQDLHDRLGSNLTTALLQARSGALSPQETVLLLQDLTDELRHMGSATSGDQRGLVGILAELRQRVHSRLEQGGIALDWAVDPDLPAMSSPQIAQHLRAMLSEAIANVIKHAQATRIRLCAEVEGEAVVITITDNGRGFDPSSAQAGRGLPGMHQRAQALGAALAIGPAEGAGCCWRLSLPIPGA